jgi:hypothetical protein
MQIEERIDQVKNCWWVGCFTTPNFHADVVHVFFVLLAYTLIQLYLKATHHPGSAREATRENASLDQEVSERKDPSPLIDPLVPSAAARCRKCCPIG